MKTAGQNVINDWLAGACGGVTGLIIGFPLDTTKVQLQTASKDGRVRVVDMFRKIRADGLFSGFFRGLTVPLLTFGVHNAIYFGMYGFALRQIREFAPGRRVSYPDLMIASFFGGMSTLFLSCPSEVIKISMQTQAGNKYFASTRPGTSRIYYHGPIDCIKSVIRERGVIGLYKGASIQTLREVPISMTFMPAFVFLDEMITLHVPLGPFAMFGSCIAGGLSGVTMWTLIMPFDTVKTRLQSDSLNTKYRGIVDCVKQTYREGGIRLFYRGLTVCYARTLPVHAIVLAVYKNVLHYLNGITHTDGIPEIPVVSE